MPAKNPSLHGSAPDKSKIVLLLIDVINDLNFPEADLLLPHALPMAKTLKKLKTRARAAGIPAIYINDNFSRWQSNFNLLIEHCLKPHCKSRAIVTLLRPQKKDYFVLKPKHSAFFSTTLDVLLNYLGAETLIITGIAANVCVLFTANDAYMRDYNLIIPSDCVVSNTLEEKNHALQQMKKVLKANIRLSTEIRFPSNRSKR